MKLFKASADDSSLKLAYTFRPVPDPIRASPDVGDPRTVEMRVIVSNPRTRSVELKSVVIRFPLGQDIAAHLSGLPRLPAPILVTPGNWTVDLTAEHNGVLIRPTGAASSIVFSGNPLIFAIPGIQINTKPGAVALDITEKLMEGDLNPGIAELEKLEADFPVSSFTATPNVITDLKQAAMLNWVCTPEGQKRSYSVHSDDWRPRDCVVKNECYTCSDGVTGVRTGTVSDRTDFYLDVILAQEGQRKVQKTLSTRVLFAPLKLEDSHHLDVSASGRIAKVGWLANNAVRCSVFVNDKLVDENAPADTYLEEDRYYLGFLAPGDYRIEVVAHGATGAQTSRRSIGIVKVVEPIKVADRGSFRGGAIASDGKSALLLPPKGQDEIRPLDIPKRILLDGIAVGGGLHGFILLDRAERGSNAWVAGAGSMASMQLLDLPFVSPLCVGAALAPRRRVMLFRTYGPYFGVCYNETPSFFHLRFHDCWGLSVIAAIAPDEKTGYIAINPGPGGSLAGHKSIGIVDLTANPDNVKITPMDLDVGMEIAEMAISADGARLILTGTKADSPAKVVNLVVPQIIDTIPGAGPGVAFMPDGRSVLLGSERSLGLYHLERKEFQKWNANFPASVLAIAPGGAVALAASSQDKGIYLL